MKATLATIAGVLVAVLTWVLLAPPAMGGSASYVTVVGSSMEPNLHNGDAVMLRPADKYEIGDTVAYRSSLGGALVLHRIIGTSGENYIVKGDNNNFVDVDEPGTEQIVGRQVFYFPMAAGVFNALRSPAGIGVLVALMACIMIAAIAGTKRRRGKVGVGPESGSGVSSTASAAAMLGTPTFWGALTGLALVAAVFAWVNPTMTTDDEMRPYTVEFDFDYSSDLPPNPVYQSSTLKFGQPIFRNIVDEITVGVNYSAVGTGMSIGQGNLRLRADVQSLDGWSKTVATSSVSPIEGNLSKAQLRLNFNRINKIVNEVNAATGQNGATTLRVVADALVDGQLVEAGINPGKISGQTSSALEFALTPSVVRLANGSATPAPSDVPAGGLKLGPGQAGASGATGPGGASGLTGPGGASGLTGPGGASGLTGPGGASGLTGPGGASGLTGPGGASGQTGPGGASGNTGPGGASGNTGPGDTSSNTGAPGSSYLVANGVQRTTEMLSVTTFEANSVSVGPVSIEVTLLRLLTVVMMLIFAALTVVTSVLRREAASKGEAEFIAAKYGSRLIPLANADADDRWADAIELPTFDALYALSRESERSILHSHTDEGDSYFLKDGNTTYVYRISAQPAPESPEQPDSPLVDLMASSPGPSERSP